jgi:uncharacterized glyoxalase superfamily protein PhnB
MKARKIRPFIPSGEDYALAQRFLADLGFEKVYATDDMCIFRNESAEFFLQNFHNQELQDNYMVSLSVEDLDGLWAHIQRTGLEEKYPIKVRAPEVRPWGREIALIDPSGVCWHITQI